MTGTENYRGNTQFCIFIAACNHGRRLIPTEERKELSCETVSRFDMEQLYCHVN